MSPIDNWDEFGPVFTNGPETFWTVFFVILAVAMFIGFFVRMILHEKHAYAQMAKHQPVEKGPAVEGEPPVV
ncbi:MAG: hypothetical protein ACSLEW_03885 [Nocardioides sp.]